MELVVVAGLVLCFGLAEGRLGRWNVTAPMAFVAAGIVLAGFFPEASPSGSSVHALAELTLVVLLFHDASTVQLSTLRRDAGLPVRLLAFGFPLALVSTSLVIFALFPELGWAAALLIAASVTPTDAGLGAPTVLNPIVPVRIRRALNVESGLNDGLATPIVLFALAVVVAEEGGAVPRALEIAVVPVALALVVGIVSAWLAAKAVDASSRAGWSVAQGRAVGFLAVPLVTAGIADVVEANLFIAAFVAGLVFGSACRTCAEEEGMSDLLETSADLLGYVVWFLAGGLAYRALRDGPEWEWLVAAVLVLTVLRMAPVAVCLIGSKLRPPTVAFIGWFGPRGLASVIFALISLEDLPQSGGIGRDLAGVIATTVVLSVFAHGFTAGPLSRRYGAWVAAARPERETASDLAPRSRGAALSSSPPR